jgi:hypothetical protein
MTRSFSLTLVTLLAVLFSCTEEIEVKLDSSDRRLVVEGSFSDDTLAHQVRLSKSADYFVNQALQPVLGAMVTISDGTTIFPLTESLQDSGLYLTAPDVHGTPGQTYTLTIDGVDIDGDGITESYTASGKVNPLGPVDSIQVKYKKIFYQDVWAVNFFAQEPGETRDYYVFRTWKNGVNLKDTLLELNPSDDEIINGVYSDGMTVQYLFADKPDEKLVQGDTIMLEIQGITKEYYQFIFDVMSEAHGSDPFGGQPANVSTNLSNGAVGFFNTYSVKRLSRVYDGN